MKGAELDRHAGSNSNERRKGAFVKCQWAFLGIDLFGGIKGVGVLGCCLQPDLDDIEWLTCEMLDCSRAKNYRHQWQDHPGKREHSVLQR
jgi:hypothetical protein